VASQRPSGLILYARLLREVRSRWPLIGALFLLGLLSAPIALLIPLPLKIAVDSIIGSEPLAPALRKILPTAMVGSPGGVLALAAMAVVAIALADHLQRLALATLAAYTGERLVLDFRAKLFRHVQRLSLSYHDIQGAAESTYRIHWDAACIQWVAVYGITPFLSGATTLAGMFFVTAMLDWELALAALAVAPAVTLISFIARRRLHPRYLTAKELESRAVATIQEALSALRVIKAFGQEDREQSRIVGSLGQTMRARIGLTFAENVFELLTGLTLATGSALVFYLGVRRVQAGILSLGDLVLVMGYLARLYGPFQEITKSINLLQASIASAERAFALLDEPPEVVEKVNARGVSRAKGQISFQDVSFSYPGVTPFVLDGLSFDIKPGSRVGITGTTGAGKTTLVSLLLRLYDPSAGRILLDGVDLRDYKVADLRNQFSVALQEPILFSVSVAENIAYARPQASENEVVAAAKLANVHDFIMTLPDGYQTLVGERGMRLSGGERQRIALARAFLKDAPILVLDEPTSSVDLKTESAIMDAMERLMHGRTTLMIAHRLSTLSQCDLRLALENGRSSTVWDAERSPSVSHHSEAAARWSYSVPDNEKL
jgi:ATP-binding cassette, subfamily B, bacterial